MVRLAATAGYKIALQELPKYNESFKLLETKMEKLGELIEQDAAAAHDSSGGFLTINIIISLVGGILCLIGGYLVSAQALSNA